jgi:hypothetical protein
MDGNTTITISFLFLVLGGVIGVFGYISKRDAKTYSEGKDDGALQETLRTMQKTLKAIEDSNHAFQADHRNEHKEINARLTKVEHDYIRFSRESRSDLGE